MPNLIGKSLGRYHILEQLGEGGMAIVYKAFDTQLEREVALKIIRVDAILPNALERTKKRFEREAKALAKLNHPNIVPIMDSGQEGDTPYLVMGYIPGGTLKKKITGNPLPWREAAQLLIPIAQALAYSHKQGIVHRDIKPLNILITAENEPMLTDFGIARILQQDETLDLTGTGMGVGTPEYMAPEQGLGHKVDHRADIYALGIIFYEMLTGRKPFQADTPMAVVVKQINDPLPRPSLYAEDMPSGVENILIKSLAKDPKHRYKSMGEFVAALVKTPVSDGNKKRKSIWKQAFAAIRIFGLLGLGFYLTNHFVFSKPDPIIASTDTFVANSTLTNNTVTETPDLANIPVLTSTPELPPANAKLGDVWIRPSDEMRMSFIPEGEFQMGSQNGGADEKPVHTVFLDDFWIDQIVVTNDIYGICVAATYCDRPGGDNFETRQYSGGAVVNVTWDNAEQYCEWAGGRLPTEAEWEKALRSEYLVKEDVFEWVADWYDNMYYAVSPLRNPIGPLYSVYRVLRDSSAEYRRSGRIPASSSSNISFRCVYDGNQYEISSDTNNLDVGSKEIRLADGMTMMFIPGGDFQMGSEVGDADEQPIHKVYLDPFWMDETEVTNKMYANCEQANICTAPGGSSFSDPQFVEYPVVYVSWDNANTYCSWVGGRLPTEAEWEKVARGGQEGKIYPWGDELIACVPGINSNCSRKILGVGRVTLNSYGLHDLSGNVWEWVNDWYDGRYYETSSTNNPTGPETGTYRVRRGGTWSYTGNAAGAGIGTLGGYVRVAGRFSNAPSFNNEFGGFRCARDVD